MLAVLCFPRVVFAHVLVKDTTTDSGAVLHITPDDDPVAGEQAALFYDIRDPSLAMVKPEIMLTVTDAQGSISTLRAHVQGTSVSASYVFPRQGVYRISLLLLHDGRQLHDFTYSQRISRGTAGTVHYRAPAWAEVGSTMALLSLGALAIVVFNRRDAINKYSTFEH